MPQKTPAARELPAFPHSVRATARQQRRTNQMIRKFLNEFQAFISRGNVLDLAVAVIIGAAFSKIVDSLVKDIVNPILGVLVGRPDFTNLFIVLKPVPGYSGPNTYEALVKAGATVFGYGAFLTAVIQFLLLAFAVFWLIKIVMTARAKITETAEKLLAHDAAEAQKKADEAKAAEEAQKAREAAEAEAKRREEAERAAAVNKETVALLTEIRDLLKKNAG